MRLVRVYKNLTRGGYSIQEYVTGKGWRVIDHADAVILEHCTFIVNQKGRERVVREKKKYVHAFIQGALLAKGMSISMDHFLADPNVNVVYYNPYRCTQFEVHQPGGDSIEFGYHAVNRADMVSLGRDGVFAEHARWQS